MVLTPILTIPLADVPLLTFRFQALQGALGDIPSHSIAQDIFLSGKKGKSSFFKESQLLGCWALKYFESDVATVGDSEFPIICIKLAPTWKKHFIHINLEPRG